MANVPSGTQFKINSVLKQSGNLRTFNGLQLVALSSPRHRLRELREAGQTSTTGSGFCFLIPCVFRVTHFHLQRPRGRSLFLCASTHRVLLAGKVEAQSDARERTDAMFPWIIKQLADKLQFMSLQTCCREAPQMAALTPLLSLWLRILTGSQGPPQKNFSEVHFSILFCFFS